MRNLSCVIISVLFAVGCTSSESDPGVDHSYVMDTLVLPSNPSDSRDLAFDVDGDGLPDNALGNALALLGSQGGGGLGLQSLVDESLEHGHVFVLQNVRASDLNSATGVESMFLRGSMSAISPCADVEETECGQHLMGDGSFQVDPSSPDASIMGSIVDGWFTGGPGRASVQVALSDSAEPMTFNLISAYTEYSVGESITEGRIGGGVAHEDVNEIILPGIKELMDVALSEDCTGSGEPCCDADSIGETLISLFDVDGDCSIGDQELRDNPIVAAVLAPDVDLRNSDGELIPDGIPDSVSLGVAYSAVRASFDMGR